MKKRSGYCLCLQGDDSIALKVRAGEEGSYYLEWIERFSAESASLNPRIRELTRARSRVVQIIPDDEVSLMTVILPAMKAKSQKTALQGIVVKEKGGHFGDWVIDFRTVSRKHRGSSQGVDKNIAAVIVKRELIEKQYADAEKLGCYPTGMISGYLALEQLIRCGGPEIKSDGAWNLVFLGDKNRFMCVCDREDILFSRILPENLSGSKGEDEYIERISKEIERSNFFAQQDERNMPVRSIIICGEPGKADKLAETLTNRTEQEIIRWRPEEIFISDDRELLWEDTLNLAVAATALPGPRYNLLPPVARNRTARQFRRYTALATAAVGAVALPTIFIGGLLTSRVQGNFLRDADERLGVLENQAQRAAEFYLLNHALKDCQRNMEKLNNSQPELALLLRSIAQRTPYDVIYKSIDISREDNDCFRLILLGESIASNGEQAQRAFLQFMESLDACPYLQRIEEPVNLEISGKEDSGIQLSRVAFTLEYIIRGGK